MWSMDLVDFHAVIFIILPIHGRQVPGWHFSFCHYPCPCFPWSPHSRNHYFHFFFLTQSWGGHSDHGCNLGWTCFCLQNLSNNPSTKNSAPSPHLLWPPQAPECWPLFRSVLTYSVSLSVSQQYFKFKTLCLLIRKFESI